MFESKAKLIKNGVKPSLHRLMVYENLSGRCDHPSAEHIYKDLCALIPTLSRTTVYNTLELFVEHGLAGKLSIIDGQARFDADVLFHAHFYCRKCRQVFDVSSGKVEIDEPDNYLIEGKQVFLYGICPECSLNTLAEISNNNKEEEK